MKPHPPKSGPCGTQAGSAWFDFDPKTTRDHSHIIAAEDARKSARKGKWEKKKAKKGR